MNTASNCMREQIGANMSSQDTACLQLGLLLLYQTRRELNLLDVWWLVIEEQHVRKGQPCLPLDRGEVCFILLS